MGAQVRHRGPDGEGRWVADDAAIVHCRLRVIDLSREADQPLARPDLDAVIVYNGEIYNYRELRADLERRGMRFRTASDTEVLLAGLVEQGTDFLRRLRGMFALALWRPRARALLLARDPLGKKPLFWTRQPDGAVVLGSTLGSVLAGLGGTPPVSSEAVAQYFCHLAVPQDQCIYRGIQRVPPGSWVRLGADGPTASGAYWAVAREPRWTGGRVEAVERVTEALRVAVRRRLVADVPVGAFLSAGRDSG